MLSKKIVISPRAGIHDFVNVGDNGTMQPYQVEDMCFAEDNHAWAILNLYGFIISLTVESEILFGVNIC